MAETSGYARGRAMSPWLRGTEEVAGYMRRGKDEASRLIHSGAIPSHREPGRASVLVYAPDVDEYLRSLPSANPLVERLGKVA